MAGESALTDDLIERAIDRYRAKYPRLYHPQPSKHKSYIADDGRIVLVARKLGTLAEFKLTNNRLYEL